MFGFTFQAFLLLRYLSEREREREFQPILCVSTHCVCVCCLCVCFGFSKKHMQTGLWVGFGQLPMLDMNVPVPVILSSRLLWLHCPAVSIYQWFPHYSWQTFFDNDKNIAPPPLPTPQCKDWDAHIAYYGFESNKQTNRQMSISGCISFS